MGVNGLIADDPALLAPIGWVREYHNWGWICQTTTRPARRTRRCLYTSRELQRVGLGHTFSSPSSRRWASRASPPQDVQGMVPWMNNSGHAPPVNAGADPTAAARP